MTWVTDTRGGTAETLHEFVAPERPQRTLRLLEVDRPTIVLGSTQRSDDIDALEASAAGVEVARRRSGGGAVLLVPHEHVWIDFWLPAGDPLWDDDVVRSAGWIGEAFRGLLAETGWSDLMVHRGSAVQDPVAPSVCFLGRGPGEVFSGERKLLGISQRRTREWIRIQTLMHRRFDARLMATVMSGRYDAAEVVTWQQRVGAIGDIPVSDVLGAHLPV